MEKIKVHKSLEINVPAKEIFNFITDPIKIPAILPGLIKNSGIPDLPLKVGDSFEYTYQMYGVILEGLWIVDEIDSPHTYKAHTTGDSESWWTQIITETNGISIIDLTIEYKMPEGVLSKIKERALISINEKEADHMIHNLKTILEMK